MRFLDLFAGAGGLSEGFIQAGFEPVAHVEMNKEACDTLRTRVAYHHFKDAGNIEFYNRYLAQEISRDELWKELPDGALSSVINESIGDETKESIFKRIDEQADGKRIDVIIGGPPCQAYSLVGRSRDPYGMQFDERNYLYRYYGDFLRRYEPEYFVFENVLGLLSAGNQRYLVEMRKLFEEIGYRTDFKVLKAEEYGVLQKRKRVILIGRRGSAEFTFPDMSTIEGGWTTLSDLFYDLPRLKPGEELSKADYTQPSNEYLRYTAIRNGNNFVTQHITRDHNKRDLEIYAIAIEKWINEGQRLKYDKLPSNLQSHNNKSSFLDRYKVVDPFGPSHTVVAHIAKDGHYYIYPDVNQVRSLSVREAARIQSFPDNYFFEGGRTAAFKQIGNAVPVLMAKEIANSVKEKAC